MSVYLETERLVLRRCTPDDVDNLVDLNGDPEVMRYLTNGKPIPREEIRDVVLPGFLRSYERRAGYGVWAVVEKATGEFLGWLALQVPEGGPPGEASLGYRLRRAAWGKGYATEGARALIRQGFTELGAQRVTAQTMAVNAASRRVMEKAGLSLARIFHQEWPDPIPGTEQGEVEYALTRADWERREASGGSPSAGGIDPAPPTPESQ